MEKTTLTKSLDEQKRSGKKLGRVFVDLGFVTEKQISVALARQLNIPFIDLNQLIDMSGFIYPLGMSY